MKTKNKSLLNLFIIIGLIFTLTFSCTKDDETDIVKDIDGNVYHTVTIGTQVWMVENLKTTTYRNGDPITNVTENEEWSNFTTGAYCNYDNLESNAEIYGRLYNWYAVNTGKLAPEGWHVPTDDDWTILENYLFTNGYNYDGTKDDEKIAKSLCARTKWALSNNEGAPGAAPNNNNSSGFTALPCGTRGGNGGFNYIGNMCKWWSSSEKDTGDAYYRSISYDYDYFGNGYYIKRCGYSVRCVKN